MLPRELSLFVILVFLPKGLKAFAVVLKYRVLPVGTFFFSSTTSSYSYSSLVGMFSREDANCCYTNSSCLYISRMVCCGTTYLFPSNLSEDSESVLSLALAYFLELDYDGFVCATFNEELPGIFCQSWGAREILLGSYLAS